MTTAVQDFFTVMKGRRSVRHYDPSYRISDEELKQMLEEATLAPSGSNLQPWKFLVINDKVQKEQLLPIAFHQQQVADASAVIAVLGDLEAVSRIEKIYSKAVEAGYMTEEVKNTIVANTKGYLSKMDTAGITRGVLIDCGLVSMQFMLVARAHGYDTVPMAGYDPQKLVEAFNIPERYVPVMLIAVGKAAKPGHPTVRLPIEDVVSFNRL